MNMSDRTLELDIELKRFRRLVLPSPHRFSVIEIRQPECCTGFCFCARDSLLDFVLPMLEDDSETTVSFL